MFHRHIVCVVGLLCAVTAAQAQQHSLTTERLNFSHQSIGYDPELHLLSDNAGVTQLDLGYISQGWQRLELTGDFYNNTFEVAVAAGYRVTGIQLSGSFYGELQLTPLTHSNYITEGSVSNRAFIGANLVQGAPVASDVARQTNVTGSNPYLVNFSSLNLTGSFQLALEAGALAPDDPAIYEECYFYEPPYGCGGSSYVRQSHMAAIGIRAPVLTLYTQPVPEPSTYVLMGAGLFTLGALVRRRRKA